MIIAAEGMIIGDEIRRNPNRTVDVSLFLDAICEVKKGEICIYFHP